MTSFAPTYRRSRRRAKRRSVSTFGRQFLLLQAPYDAAVILTPEPSDGSPISTLSLLALPVWLRKALLSTLAHGFFAKSRTPISVLIVPLGKTSFRTWRTRRTTSPTAACPALTSPKR